MKTCTGWVWISRDYGGSYDITPRPAGMSPTSLERWQAAATDYGGNFYIAATWSSPGQDAACIYRSGPTNAPTQAPTQVQTTAPTAPTLAPTNTLSVAPTAPTRVPTLAPTVSRRICAPQSLQ